MYYTNVTSDAVLLAAVPLALLLPALGSTHVQLLTGSKQSSCRALACPGSTHSRKACPPDECTAGPEQTHRHSSPSTNPALNSSAAKTLLTQVRQEVPVQHACKADMLPCSVHMHCRRSHTRTHTTPQHRQRRSELHQLLSCVANLLQVGYAGKLDHGWGPTHCHDGIRPCRQQVLPHHVLVDEAAAVLPVLRRPEGHKHTRDTEQTAW